MPVLTVLALSRPQSWAVLLLLIVVVAGPILAEWRYQARRARDASRVPLANRYAERRR